MARPAGHNCLTYNHPLPPRLGNEVDLARYLRDQQREMDLLMRQLNRVVCDCCAGTTGGTGGTVGSPVTSSVRYDCLSGNCVANVLGAYPDLETCLAFCMTPEPGCESVTITLDDTLADGYTCVVYSGQINAMGGTSPYTYAVIVGAIPQGLTMSSAGTFSGTPAGAETAIFTVRATDAEGCTGERGYSVTVTDPCLITGVTNPCGHAKDCADCCSAMAALGIGGSLLNQNGQTNISLLTCLGISVSGNSGSFVWCGKTFEYSIFEDEPGNATCSAYKLYDILRTA